MGHYEVSRTATVAADAATVHALVDDFHRWPAWSPWEDLDPAIRRTYGGAESGVGATYAWEGNRKAGAGSMAITSSSPGSVGIALEFLEPFRSTSTIDFGIVPTGSATTVTWTMRGEQTGLMGVLGKVVSMDRLVGKDFERGLARLKAAAEGP